MGHLHPESESSPLEAVSLESLVSNPWALPPISSLSAMFAHSVSDSLDFGEAGEGGNIHQECNPGIVEPPDQINAPSRAVSPSIPPTMITALMPSRLQHSPGLCTIPSSNRPLTRSVAN